MTSWASFSIAELIVCAICVYVAAGICRTVIRCVRNGVSSIPGHLAGILLEFCTVASVLYFLFVALWGVNYNRLPFAEAAGIEAKEFTTAELNEACLILINRTNALREFVDTDENGNVALPGSKTDVLKKSWVEYDNVRADFPTLDKKLNSPKPVILSEAMCFAGITGVYFALTGEANVNMEIGPAELPFTACHELAHQAGYAREDEANFISWLVCDRSSNIEFKYSGNLMAMIHVLNSLYEADAGRWTAARGLCSEGVNSDLNAQGQFWERYEGVVQEVSTSVNDTYLKANLQEEGVKSYGRMVDLTIAYLLAENK